MSVGLKSGNDSLEPAAPRALFPVRRIDSGIPPYLAARDGQRFLISDAPEKAAPSLTVIANWPALLK